MSECRKGGPPEPYTIWHCSYHIIGLYLGPQMALQERTVSVFMKKFLTFIRFPVGLSPSISFIATGGRSIMHHPGPPLIRLRSSDNPLLKQSRMQ